MILSEIQGYDDSPSELIFDRAEELLFPRSFHWKKYPGFGRIPGQISERNALEKFQTENYATEEMVLSLVGNIPFEQIGKAAEKYFGEIPHKIQKQKTNQTGHCIGTKASLKKEIPYQKHCMLVGEAYALTRSKDDYSSIC